MKNILITGGAGFIGSHLVRLMVNKYPEYRIINLDKLTYAGNLANLKDIEDKPNYVFVKADICDFEKMIELFIKFSSYDKSPGGMFYIFDNSFFGFNALCIWITAGHRDSGFNDITVIHKRLIF